jgi:hypothetical protein
MSRKIRSAVLVLVLANVFASAVNALPQAGRQGASRSESVFVAAWEWLGSLLGPLREGMLLPEEVSSVDTKAGSHMDPDGNH